MRKIFIFILLITTFNIVNADSTTADEIFFLKNEIREQRLEYDKSKVKAIVSKDIVEYSKLIEEFCAKSNIEVHSIWNFYNNDKKQYEAIIYYKLIKG